MLFWVKGRVVAETFGYVKHSIWDVENMAINLKEPGAGISGEWIRYQVGGSTPVTRRWYHFWG